MDGKLATFFALSFFPKEDERNESEAERSKIYAKSRL